MGGMDDSLDTLLKRATRAPAPRPQIRRISPTHEAILNWLVANPGAPLRLCAAQFNVSQSWLSCIIHSDIFQAKLKQRQDEHFVRLSMGLTEKLRALADVAVERMTEKVEQSEDPKFIKESFDSVLGKLGYTPTRGQAGPVMQQNNFFISKDDLAKARESIHQKSLGSEKAVVSDQPQLTLEVVNAADN